MCAFSFSLISNDWLILLRRPAVSKLHSEDALNVSLRYCSCKQVLGKWHDTPAPVPPTWSQVQCSDSTMQPQQHLSHISRAVSLLYQHCYKQRCVFGFWWQKPNAAQGGRWFWLQVAISWYVYRRGRQTSAVSHSRTMCVCLSCVQQSSFIRLHYIGLLQVTDPADMLLLLASRTML